jgi:hypothetical protein
MVSRVAAVKGQQELPSEGHETCPLTATRTARRWPWDLPKGAAGHHRLFGSGQRAHPLAGQCLGQPDGVAAGLAQVGMVQEPVDGGGSQGLGHQFVEPGWMQVRADRDRPFLVGGVDESVEPLGGVRGDRQQSDVVDDDQVGAQHPGDGFRHGIVGTMAAQQHAEVFQG